MPNQAGKRDGILKIWVDDKLVINCNNIRYRDVPELAIDALLFNTFLEEIQLKYQRIQEIREFTLMTS